MLSGIFLLGVQSDQLYKWSDGDSDTARCCTSEASQCACCSVAAASIDPAWFAYRTIQALQQAWMQMCRWSVARTKVLSFASFPGLRPKMDYVPQEAFKQVSELLANYQRTKEILEEISEINRELLRRREAL
jgi:hypothetical protein